MGQYDHLSDAEILARAGGMGPGIIGHELYNRAKIVRERTNDGALGPAITDPDYAAKQAKARAAERVARDRDRATTTSSADLTNDEPEVGPWDHVTLSGAKQLAQQHQLSYVPRVKRLDLIDALIAAGVQPPARPAPDPADEDDLDEVARAAAEGDE